MGTPSPATLGPAPLQRLVDELRGALARAGFDPPAQARRRSSSSTWSTRRSPARSGAARRGTFVAALHGSTRRRPTRCARATRCSSARSPTSSLAYVPGAGRLVHDARARQLPRPRDGRRRPRWPTRSSAARAARALAARDRQRVPHRPRARALGRRRDHRVDRRGRPPPRRARPAAGAVPGRGPRRRARPPAHQAALRHRRPLVRQPLGAQGRDALLDERERRRQVEARDARAATSCSSPDYDAEVGADRPQRAAGRRAAARLGRRDRALDASTSEHPDVDAILHVHAWLEGIPATEVNYPCGTEELAAERRRSCSPPSRIRRTRSSACATTASPPPARASSEILDRDRPAPLLVPMPLARRLDAVRRSLYPAVEHTFDPRPARAGGRRQWS